MVCMLFTGRQTRRARSTIICNTCTLAHDDAKGKSVSSLSEGESGRNLRHELVLIYFVLVYSLKSIPFYALTYGEKYYVHRLAYDLSFYEIMVSSLTWKATCQLSVFKKTKMLAIHMMMMTTWVQYFLSCCKHHNGSYCCWWVMDVSECFLIESEENMKKFFQIPSRVPAVELFVCTVSYVCGMSKIFRML